MKFRFHCISATSPWIDSIITKERARKTLLYWILFISNTVCGRPGYRSLRLCKRHSARWARNWFLSTGLTRPLTFPLHDDFFVFDWFGCLLRSLSLHMCMAASILFAISRVRCSDDRSKQSIIHSGENCSAVILRYVISPKQAFPLCKIHKSQEKFLKTNSAPAHYRF